MRDSMMLSLGFLGCGAVVGTATFIWYLWPLVFPALALVLCVLVRSSNLKQALWLGYVFGVGMIGATFSWLFTILPIDWLGVADLRLGFLLVSFAWVYYTFALAIPFGVWGVLMRGVGRTWWLLLYAPASWVALELLRAFLYSVVSWGSGSVLGIDFSFGFVGYALSWSPGFLWGAQLAGVASLSVLAVSLATLLYLISGFLPQKHAFAMVGICYTLILIVGVGMPSPVALVSNPGIVEANGLRIAPITTQIGPALSRTSRELVEMERYVARLVTEAAAQRPDIIILPEYIRFLKSENLLPDTEIQEVHHALAKSKALLIDSERASEGKHGSILFFDGAKGTVVARHNKRFLVAVGEYLPESFAIVFKMLGLSKQVESIRENRTYRAIEGPVSARIFEWKGVRLGVLACSESFAPFSYKEMADADADVLINVASYSWMRARTDIIRKETMAIARVHAVYADKPFIQASNAGDSFVIYPRSELIAGTSTSLSQN